MELLNKIFDGESNVM